MNSTKNHQTQMQNNITTNSSSTIINANTPIRTSASTTMMDSYRVGTAGAVKRIGTPHENDVLSGRGGAINSHIGNQKFRDWVRVRKERYNLARTKAEKARVANEVIDLVRGQNPPGRFLQRDQSSVTGGVTWWVEVDEIKAMAKTSQALREGAPSIRAAHKDELQDSKKRTRKSSKKNNTSSSPRTTGKQSELSMTLEQLPALSIPSLNLNTPMPPLEMSKTQAMEQLKANVEAAKNSQPLSPSKTTNTVSYIQTTGYTSPQMLPSTDNYSFGRPVKRSRLSENLYLPQGSAAVTYTPLPQPHIVKPDDETPPLEPMPSPVPLSSIPELGGDDFPMPAIPKRETSLYRANSLALSDIGSGSDAWGDLDFVNPFSGDSDELSAANNAAEFPPMSPFPEKRSSSTFFSNGTNYNGGGQRHSRNSIGNMSVRSLASDLSDLGDTSAMSPGGVTESDFGEGMKAVYDAAHPGLTSPGNDEPIPTHLYPYRGSFDLRRSDSLSSPQLIC